MMSPSCSVNRYDARARLVFHYAREEGMRLMHAMLGPEHLLLGLMREGGNAARTLREFGANLEQLRREVEAIVGRGQGLPRSESVTITPGARRVMELAGSEARSMGSATVGTEHILLSLIREADGVAYRILAGCTLVLADPGLAISWSRKVEPGTEEHTLIAQSLLEAKREEILSIAARHGAHNVKVVGLAARGEALPGSDIDLLVDFEPGRSELDQVALIADLRELLGRDVDVVTEPALYWLLRRRVLQSRARSVPRPQGVPGLGPRN